MAARRRKGRKPARRKAGRPGRKKPARASRAKPGRAPARKRAPAGTRKRAPAAKPATSGARPPTRERIAAGVPVEVGVVLHWFPHVSAAVVALSHPIHLGDTIHVRGHSTDFVQQVASLALDGAPVREGAPPQALGVRLEARARPGDRVYRVSW
jgi:putative protease